MNIFDIVMIRTTCKFLYNLVKASDSFPRHFVLDQQKCLEYYVSNGNISALDYLKAMNFLFTSPLCERAAETGRLDVLKYLRANGCLWNRMMPIFAARNGHVDILQYALEGDTKVQPLFDTQIVNMCFVEAATKGHVEVIKYLHQRGYAWDSQTVMLASHYRQFEVFKYAVEQGKFTPDYNHYGDLQFMTFAEEHNLARWKADACLRAAVNGDLEALKFAHECGAPLGLESGLGALVLAAENGHLECVKYAYMHDEKEFGRVSSVKNLEILKFLHEETDIQLDPEIYVEAVRNRRKDIVDYLLQHTSIPPPGGLARHAASSGDVKYLEWAVVDRGFDTSPLRAQYDNNIDVYATAITAGSLDCLKFAAEKKLPMGRDEDWYFSRIFEVRPPAMVEMVRWWTETYPFVFSERNTAKAIQHGSVELLDLMVQKGAKFSDDDISHVNNVRNLAYMLKATGKYQSIFNSSGLIFS